MKSNNLESIRSYIDNLQAQPGGASDAQVRTELDKFGVTPAQFAQAYGVPVEGIQARYDAVQPVNKYSPNELGNKIFTGYQQVFGRPPEKDGYDFWMNSFAGKNLDQTGINTILAANAGGSDIPATFSTFSDRQLSLLGGRPGSAENRVASGQTGQFFQPIYNPSSRDYMPTQQAPEQTFFSQGFNPLDYTAGPQVAPSGMYNPFFSGMQSTQSTPQTLQSRSVNPDVGMFNPFSGGPNPYAATMQSLPSAPVAPQNNPFLASYLAAYGQEGGVGQGESGESGQGGTVG